MQIKSWTDADRAMEDLKAADAKRRGLAADKDKESAIIDRRYNVRLTELTDSIEQLHAALAKFAKANKVEFKPSPSGDGRSYEHADVELGFRKTPPAVRIEDEEIAIVWLKEKFGEEYVRVVEEPKRDVLLEALKNADEGTREKFAGKGITLKQRDKFFLEVRNSE